MSQIAQGFLVPDVVMRDAAVCIGRGDARGAHSILRRHAFEAFSWSGYVALIVTEWLREQGVELPHNAAGAARDIVEKWTPLMCANRQECAVLAPRLDELAPSTGELVEYWTEFTGDASEEASQFMPDAWNWLTRLVHAGAGADWCLLLEG